MYLFDEAPYEAAGLVANVAPGFLHYGFAVPDVGAACDELRNSGGEFLMEPTTFGDLQAGQAECPGVKPRVRRL
ncbi:VOC family protein [Natronomonas sp.]|uniref:VOC family protein n=1 Tax=Natronomonas sp. TaxID=2184060 RepID=UPI00261FE1D3|nr:VOC family protein [Natronomonas sp.]